jgi:glycerol-3-phosphate acyltransferase PlsX
MAKLGAILLRPSLRPLRAKVDPEVYGGAYLVGLRGLPVIAHGSSGRLAIRNAILYGASGARNQVIERLTEQLGRRRATAEA